MEPTSATRFNYANKQLELQCMAGPRTSQTTSNLTLQQKRLHTPDLGDSDCAQSCIQKTNKNLLKDSLASTNGSFLDQITIFWENTKEKTFAIWNSWFSSYLID